MSAEEKLRALEYSEYLLSVLPLGEPDPSFLED